MPSDAKFSPSFHEVNLAIVPLHSFCQILFPIFSASLRESVIASAWLVPIAIHIAMARLTRNCIRPRCRSHCVLDESGLSISMARPAAFHVKQPLVEDAIL